MNAQISEPHTIVMLIPKHVEPNAIYEAVHNVLQGSKIRHHLMYITLPSETAQAAFHFGGEGSQYLCSTLIFLRTEEYPNTQVRSSQDILVTAAAQIATALKLTHEFVSVFGKETTTA